LFRQKLFFLIDKKTNDESHGGNRIIYFVHQENVQ
jgi:hypothetical protein